MNSKYIMTNYHYTFILREISMFNKVYQGNKFNPLPPELNAYAMTRILNKNYITEAIIGHQQQGHWAF
jgi:hypothetical protein